MGWYPGKNLIEGVNRLWEDITGQTAARAAARNVK